MDPDDGEFGEVSIRSLRVLRGPNLYAYMPVLHAEMDIGPYEEQPSNRFSGFVERLVDWLPGLKSHECSLKRPGGFVERLRRGTYLAHIVEHVALELQNRQGFDVGFGRARGTGRRGIYTVLIAYKEEEPARAALHEAIPLVVAAMHDRPYDIDTAIERLVDIAERYKLGPSTQAIVDAARVRGIPVRRLEPHGGLVQLGYGVHQKRIQASETSNTSAIAVDMCQDKSLTNRMLRVVGLPVPDGRAVRSAVEAWETARDVGLPVVVKPEAGNQGKGVSINLRTGEEVRAAFEIADDVRRGDVLVERYVEGDDYRLLVVNGKMVAAARRDPAMVTGDGQRTVRELVGEANRDPRRGNGHANAMTRIQLDDAAHLALQQQGLTADAVPGVGQKVRLRQNANLSTGGTATDVTDEVHPDNARLVELAAQIMDMDVAGIDVICRDISRPLNEQGGAIVEVNAAPGLRMHLSPAFGRPRPVGRAIVEMLYPRGASSRIPIVAVTGTNGKTTVTRLVAHMYETARKRVGMTTTEGTYIGGERIIKGDCSGPKSAQAVLLHPQVEVAVLETARGGILREGLAFDWCDVGVVTNVTADHLGLRGIETVEDLAHVKQVVVENVKREGAAVLNAEDPLVAQMAAATEGRVIYFSTSASHPVVAAHRAGGGECVVARNGSIVLVRDGAETELLDLQAVPFTAGGRIHFQVQNALAAVAAAWSVGMNPALIARALTTFETDAATVPGRFNVLDLDGRQVIFDYGHNPAAMRALGQAMEAFDRRRTIMLMGLPGDRRDEDLLATLDATLPFVDEYVIYDQTDRRGREPMEVPKLLRLRLPDGKPSVLTPSQESGVQEIWQRTRPGDRALVIADEVDEALEVLHALARAGREEPVCVTPLRRVGRAAA